MTHHSWTRTARALGLLAATGWVVLTVPAMAHAHAIGAEAKLAAGRVELEAYYDDDTPGADAAVTVTGPGGKVVAEGRTDPVGRWSFPRPPAGKYRVTIDAGGGHRATIGLTIPPPAPPVASPRPAGDPVNVSDGPTRSEFTGPTRYVWAAGGIIVIGAGTWVLTRLMRDQKYRPPAG